MPFGASIKRNEKIMNKAAEIIAELGYVVAYLSMYEGDENPEREICDSFEEASYCFISYYDVRFSRQ
tara:strand:- start:22165 stop:22365 length:201 start_codon:yes stop_codon:yes gene_type:complete